eukprot:CAMPEP_0206223744 /NCGR_PEP_ID=MMETSP0047_2-20121206/6650_1 /ASSEMBLY_ACC=CAM_ASM_000192 /TAXON_ID=195065 /ORGANISM="Chroomonas mesostigmatica_cf, Strain CCMP1168" /LENGTH=143 /DNA_ID=CAMNT_0053646643 /DNA_START=74 /DNA_END=502 /DNA_ORIENTATION=-
MNPTGGPFDAPATDRHKTRAELSLAEVDAQRRKEFNRRKLDMERRETIQANKEVDQILTNLGWPFANFASLPEKEVVKRCIEDWEAKWDEERGGIMPTLAVEDLDKKEVPDVKLFGVHWEPLSVGGTEVVWPLLHVGEDFEKV